ncbi:MAG TPA: ribbon-helix-helix protein, CopG family [Dehalococcoidia bacterium]|nr:ribbon-helix-helix protein, CopG family [Dehalococcoidia bacterium]
MTKHIANPEESARAAWYQEHKNDPDFLEAFEVVPPPKKPRGRPSQNMGARISVRFTPEEMESIRAKSQEEGVTYSEVVRRAVQELCRTATH